MKANFVSTTKISCVPKHGNVSKKHEDFQTKIMFFNLRLHFSTYLRFIIRTEFFLDFILFVGYAV